MSRRPTPPGEIPGAIQYAIPHVVVRARGQQKGKRTLYPVGGKLVRVEEYASRLLEEAGWSVFKGDDAHLFFSVLSCNFTDSFFRQVCRNWVGPSAEEHIPRLDKAVAHAISTGRVQPALVDEAEAMLLKYYASYAPKRATHAAIAKHARRMDQTLLLRLIPL